MSGRSASVTAFDELTPLTLDTVAEGDLVFGSQESGPFQRIIDAVGAGWRHVGLATQRGSEMFVVEAALPTVRHRALSDFCLAYPKVGVARPEHGGACLEGATAWLDTHVAQQSAFAWDDFVLAGVLSLTRRRLPAGLLDEVTQAVLVAAEHVARTESTNISASYTCSALISSAFSQAGNGCALAIDLTEQVDTGQYSRSFSESAGGAPRMPDISAIPQPAVQRYLDEFCLYQLLDVPVDAVAPRDALPLGSFGGTSILTPKGVSGAGPSPDDLIDAAKVVLHGLAGGATGSPATDRKDRWVTPGDLWLSPSMSNRYRLDPG